MADEAGSPNRTGARQLRTLLERPGATVMVGVATPLAARTAEVVGLESLHIGGSLMAATVFGLPDQGQVGSQEQLDHAARVVAATRLPVVADLDDGGGNPVRIRRTVERAEQIGLAGFHLEDADFSYGKHFVASQRGPFDITDRLLPTPTAVENIRAAVDARRDPDTVIIARTDAHTLTSVDDAIDRASRYAEVGADLVMFPLIDNDQLARVAAAVSAPIMHVFSGVGGEELLAEQRYVESCGATLVVHVGAPTMAGVDGTWKVLEELKATGTTSAHWGAVHQKLLTAVDASGWSEFARTHAMRN